MITVNRNVGGLLSVVTLLALAGCGGGYESSSAQADDTKTSTAAASTASTTTPAAMQTATARMPAEAGRREAAPTAPKEPAQTAPRELAQMTANEPAKTAPAASLTGEQMTAVDAKDPEPRVRDLSKLSADGKPREAVPTAPSTLKVEPARLDLGTVATNKHASGKVRLTNSGAEPITIQDCKASCGCTSTNCPKGKELQPGEMAEVDIRLSGGNRARKISKTVTFRVVDQQPVILPVSVEVIAYVTIDPMTIDPEKVPDGKVVIKATDGKPFRITNMSPPVIETFSEETSTEHELFIDWDQWRELGQGRRLLFNLDHPEANQVTMIVRTTPVRRASRENPIQRTRERLRQDGVVDAPLETPDPPAKAAIAVKYGQVEEMKKQLAEGLTEAQRNELLNLAARHGQVEVMGVLFEAGASASATDKRGRTPLMAAVQSRKPEAIRYLIDKGADVNARDQLQGTALLRAAGAFGNLESVQVLLSAGAAVNVHDKNGMTPLMWAARWGDAPRVEALVRSGANVDARDNAGKTALDWARSRGEKAAATVEILQPLTESEAKATEPGKSQID